MATKHILAAALTLESLHIQAQKKFDNIISIPENNIRATIPMIKNPKIIKGKKIKINIKDIPTYTIDTNAPKRPPCPKGKLCRNVSLN